MKRVVGIWAAACLLASLGACAHSGAALQRVECTRVCMGVQARVVLYAPDESTGESAAREAFARLAALDDVMSDYRPESELMRLCRAAPGPAPVSKDLAFILARSSEVAAVTDGAFDPTIGPLVSLWRRSRKSGVLPSESERMDALARAGWAGMTVDERARTVAFTLPDPALDLGGIGKCHAASEAVAVLKSLGYSRCLVALAGDIAVGKPPPEAAGWKVDLVTEHSGAVSRSMLLSNCAISTSGDSEQFVEIEGVRYAHIVDPKTGLGVRARRSVTTIASEGWLADSLCTAGCVMGPVSFLKAVAAHYPKVQVIYVEHGDLGSIELVYDPDERLQWAPLASEK